MRRLVPAAAFLSHRFRLSLSLALVLVVVSSKARSNEAQVLQGVGTIAGRVIDQDGRPIPYANIIIQDTPWGAMSVDDGSFRIVKIPGGTYTVRAEIIGYTQVEQAGVQVTPNGVANVEFAVTERPAGELPEVPIIWDRGPEGKESQIRTVVFGEDIETLPLDEITDVLAMRAGIIARAGELHARGGRDGEINVTLDGVAIKDPLLGSTSALATLGVETTELILGGLDAEHGGTQSGVINYTTKEGGREFEGQLYYMTDDYGQPDNTYENLDRIFLGLGGPGPIRNLTYYLSAEGTFADAYPATPRDRGRSRILDFISVGDRKSNSVRLQTKLAYKSSAGCKLTGELVMNSSHSDVYQHMWSRVGYVQTFRDTTETGEVVTRKGRWSPYQMDETYEYYNPANHTPTDINRFHQAKLVWLQTIDGSAFYDVKVSRTSFYLDSRVGGKNAWEYEGERLGDLWFNYTDRSTEPYFVISGDYPSLSHRETVVYTLKSDLTKRYQAHTVKSGGEARYNDMKYFQVDRPFATNAAGQIGGARTRYHYFNPEGSWYVQDRWEHEGMVLNIGVRYDLFSVGQQLNVSEVSEPVKQQFSPRIGIAYPISDRDAFSFHYGRFYQIPDRQYLFDNREAFDGRVRGNPNLTNETNVSYQAALQHLFSGDVSGQFSVYYRDMFGLVSSEPVAGFGQVSPTETWVNRDYASARGFEATLSRRFAHGWGGEINYGFGVATGVASDPNAARANNLRYLPISEQPLDWDVRHAFRVQATLAELGNWLASFVLKYESGSPYTPESRDTRERRPEDENSRRLSSYTTLDIQAEKHYEVWGRKFKLFLRGQNVLDARNITEISPPNSPTPPGSIGDDYRIYYTETGLAGGAFLGEDVDGDGIGDWVPLQDPRVFGEPRSVRVGMQLNF